VTSSSATLTVTQVPPAITAQPSDQAVSAGATATFSVTATGPVLNYQWWLNSVVISGATSTSFTTPVLSVANSGDQYKVVVSNPDGSVTSTIATLTVQAVPTLSADQQIFENFILTGGGNYGFGWNLNYAGAEVSGTNYAYSYSAVMTQSPLTHGPQTVTGSAPVNMAATLAQASVSPNRVLKNGVILVVPLLQTTTIMSYVGSAVQVDSLAADNSTLAYSETRSAYSSAFLTGLLSADTSDSAHWLNSFYSNPAIFTAGAQYQAGAAYTKYTATAKGDRYLATDCGASTTTANISPCVTGTTLSAAMAAGRTSVSDGVTYTSGLGAFSTVGGVPMWIATAARPQSATLSTTVEYRTYFELNGNVYTGVFIPDGTVLGGSYYVSNPAGLTVTDRLTFLPFQIRMNKAARDSMAAAVTF
jgi:hypothetical protein